MRLDFTLLALAAPLAVFGDLRHSHRRIHSHYEIAKRADASIQLHKRFSGARWTFYDVGGAAGACGQFNTPDQHIVALNSAQYGSGYPGPNCWRKIIMKYGGKQTTAVITDECPGCPYGGLDLTRGLFEFFADLGVGVLTGEWSFADDDDGSDSSPTTKASPKPSPTHTPTTTHKPDPPPTTTHAHTTKTTEPSTSSTHSSTHQSSSSSSSSSDSSLVSSSIGASSSVFSALATPTGVITTDGGEPQNILGINQVLVDMGDIVVAAVAI